MYVLTALSCNAPNLSTIRWIAIIEYGRRNIGNSKFR
jgi:hypothetical protein